MKCLECSKTSHKVRRDGNDSEDGRSNIEEYRRPFKTRVRPQKPSCFARKSQVAYAFSTAGSKSGHRFLKVNLSKLETDTLLRYWKRFKLVMLFLYCNWCWFSFLPFFSVYWTVLTFHCKSLIAYKGWCRSSFFQTAACWCCRKAFQLSGKSYILHMYVHRHFNLIDLYKNNYTINRF